ncbi:MAG: CsiV family protein [Gammaproteobacteria bacterium]|nr:CsiV family protein [Gammaproteobacteria bacterium]
MHYSKSYPSRARAVITLALCLVIPVMTFGQAAGNDEEVLEKIEYPPRFQVELIVFRQLYPKPGNEQFNPPYDPFSTASLDELDALLSEIGDPDDFALVDPSIITDTLAGEELATGKSDDPLEDLEGDEEPEPGRELQIVEDEEQWQLADVIERISNSRDFQLLTYQVWQQDGVLFDETETFVLPVIDNDAGLLEGTATLSLSRFLHLLVEIDWLPREKNEGFPLYRGLAGLIAKPTPYSIKESRLVLRSGDIHYFDHPHFGVVAQIKRVEEIEPELDEDGNPIIPDDAAAATS